MGTLISSPDTQKVLGTPIVGSRAEMIMQPMVKSREPRLRSIPKFSPSSLQLRTRMFSAKGALEARKKLTAGT